MAKHIQVIIDSGININLNSISKEELRDLKKILTKGNPEYYRNLNVGRSVRGISPSYKLYKINKAKETIWISRGEENKVKKILDNYIFSVSDRTTKFLRQIKIKPKGNFKLWPKQIKAVEAILKHRQGLILGVCGSGKTEILLEAFYQSGMKCLVIVDKLKLMDQWIERANKRFDNLDIKTIGAGKWGIGELTIGSQKTLFNRIDEIKDEFGMVACDETHHYAARCFHGLISKLSASYRIGVTATIKRKDQKEFLVYSAFGNVINEITDDDLLKLKKIIIVKMIIVPTEFKPEHYLVVRKNYLVGGEEIIDYDYHQLLKEMKINKRRNELILYFLKKEIKNKHRCIIFADRVAHCIYWKTLLRKQGIKSALMIGEKEFKEETKKAPELLLNGKVSCIIVSPMVREGFDLPELDRGFIINPSATNAAKIEQQVGRLKRIADGKKDAKCYYFWDKLVEGFDTHLDKVISIFKNVKIYRKILKKR